MALEKASPFEMEYRTSRLGAAMGVSVPASWCEVKGCQIAWVEAGELDGQAVICLHDLRGGGRDFRPLLRQRPGGIRLIVLDWPCHGRSGQLPYGEGDQKISLEQFASVLLAFVNQLGIARPILLGDRFGSAVAIRFAAEHPARVRGLVLSQPAGLIAPVWKPLGFVKNWVARAQEWLWSEPMTPAGRQELRRLAYSRARARADRNWLDRMQQAEDDLEEARLRIQSDLASLACPVLFAFSRDSRGYPLKLYLKLLDPLLKAAPQHRFTVFAGKFQPLWGEPERFAQALNGFVQSQMPLNQHQHAWLLTAVDWPTRSMNLWKCVHPECDAEQTLPEGQNANEAAGQSSTSDGSQ